MQGVAHRLTGEIFLLPVILRIFQAPCRELLVDEPDKCRSF